MTDPRTINYYEKNAETFYAQTVNVDMSSLHERFLAYVPRGGHILDAGCGSGRDAKAFLERGFKVTAFDASASLVSKASALLGQEVRCCHFNEITETGKFDGVWACASLLHIRQSELLQAMTSLVRSLKEGGALYASFKKGTGEKTDANGRHFTHMTLESIQQLIGFSGELALVEAWETPDQRPERKEESWWNFIGRKS